MPDRPGDDRRRREDFLAAAEAAIRSIAWTLRAGYGWEVPLMLPVLVGYATACAAVPRHPLPDVQAEGTSQDLRRACGDLRRAIRGEVDRSGRPIDEMAVETLAAYARRAAEGLAGGFLSHPRFIADLRRAGVVIGRFTDTGTSMVFSGREAYVDWIIGGDEEPEPSTLDVGLVPGTPDARSLVLACRAEKGGCEVEPEQAEAINAGTLAAGDVLVIPRCDAASVADMLGMDEPGEAD